MKWYLTGKCWCSKDELSVGNTDCKCLMTSKYFTTGIWAHFLFQIVLWWNNMDKYSIVLGESWEKTWDYIKKNKKTLNYNICLENLQQVMPRELSASSWRADSFWLNLRYIRILGYDKMISGSFYRYAYIQTSVYSFWY